MGLGSRRLPIGDRGEAGGTMIAPADNVERIMKAAKASFFDAVDFLACIEVLEAGKRHEIDRAVAAANAGRAGDLVKRALFGHCLMSVMTAFDPERCAGDFHLGVGMKLVAEPITRGHLLVRNGANLADIESAERRWADCLNFEPLERLRIFRNKSVAHISTYPANMEQPVVHELFDLARMTAEVAEHLAHGVGIAGMSLESHLSLYRESGRAFWDKWKTAEVL
jgi:hypothetical protein